jgi:hypothetical protein
MVNLIKLWLLSIMHSILFKLKNILEEIHIRLKNEKINKEILIELVIIISTTKLRLKQARKVIKFLKLAGVSGKNIYVVSEDAYDPKVQKLEKQQVNVIDAGRNIGSYAKYKFVHTFNLDKNVLVLDDDFIYRVKYIESLISNNLNSSNLKSPTIVSQDAVEFSNERYVNWKSASRDTLSKNIFPLGKGGVFFRKGIIKKDMLHDKKLMAIAPYADDIWLYFYCQKEGIGIKYISCEIKNISLKMKNKLKLSIINNNLDFNDSQIQSVMLNLELNTLEPDELIKVAEVSNKRIKNI